MGSDKIYILIVLYEAKLNSCFCARIVTFGGARHKARLFSPSYANSCFSKNAKYNITLFCLFFMVWEQVIWPRGRFNFVQ